MEKKIGIIRTRVKIDPNHTYAYLNSVGNGLNSNLSPIRIKPLCKVLIHETKGSENLNNIVVAMLLKHSGLIMAHLIKRTESEFIIKRYNPEILVTLPIGEIYKLYIVDDVLTEEEFNNCLIE